MPRVQCCKTACFQCMFVLYCCLNVFHLCMVSNVVYIRCTLTAVTCSQTAHACVPGQVLGHCHGGLPLLTFMHPVTQRCMCIVRRRCARTWTSPLAPPPSRTTRWRPSASATPMLTSAGAFYLLHPSPCMKRCRCGLCAVSIAMYEGIAFWDPTPNPSSE